jgi:hypothetical protein
MKSISAGAFGRCWVLFLIQQICSIISLVKPKGTKEAKGNEER